MHQLALPSDSAQPHAIRAKSAYASATISVQLVTR